MSENKQEITVKDIEKAIETPVVEAISIPVKEHAPQIVQNHAWRQIGSHLECVSCENPHGTHIGTGLILVGVDPNGHPVLEKVKLQVLSPSQEVTQ